MSDTENPATESSLVCRVPDCNFVGFNKQSITMHTARVHKGMGPGSQSNDYKDRVEYDKYRERLNAQARARRQRHKAQQSNAITVASQSIDGWRELTGFKLLTLTGEDVWIAEQIK